MTYKLSLGLKREEIIHELKLVREGIIDAYSYQKADTGIILSNLDDIIEMCEEAKDIQTVDNVKHGHWIYVEEYNSKLSIVIPSLKCSACRYKKSTIPTRHTPYCEVCGARMDEVSE